MCNDTQFALKDKLTVIVNSCDAYEDLWFPFFSLYKKYWGDNNVRLILNTESKEFYFEGLDIECIHSTDKKYGARILNTLSEVHTEYVLLLLDDFFLRKPVDMARVCDIIKWMNEDSQIAYFNSDCTDVYAEWEVDHYPGFRRIPPGSEYVLNLQAAIWRKEVLQEYWKTDISPWEWEIFVNMRTFLENEKKFYCTTDWRYSICDYGYNADGMGVFRGKWVIQDVAPLFEKENLIVDFSKRGVYDPENDCVSINTNTRKAWFNCLIRCVGVYSVFLYIIYRLYYKACAFLGVDEEADFVTFMQKRAQRRFLKQFGEEIQ